MNNLTVISICLVGNIASLTIRGRLVAGGEVAALREAIVLAGPNLALLSINLGEVEKMDAAGLSALVFAYTTAQSSGARFRLTAVNPRVRYLLSITRLDTVFPIIDSPSQRLVKV